MEFIHSVTLDKDKCTGCTNCIKRCPTEAIRVRNGKAYIITDRCIDCGECIRVCPNHAKLPLYDHLEILKNYKYTIALPAPALYGQFHNLDDVEVILNGLLGLGFDEAYQVASAAEIVSEATRKLMEIDDYEKPIISSACPAVTRLIRVRFPKLISHVLPVHAPVEVAARLAKEKAAIKTGFDPKDIGAIFISPCPAKRTASLMPLGTSKSQIDGVVAIKEVYPHLLNYMHLDNNYTELINYSGRIGIGWGSSGGEAAGVLNENYLAADGIENVVKVLENIEDDKLSDIDFIELNACSPGCVGGVLTVENPYVARTRLSKVRKYLPVACNHMRGEIPGNIVFDKPLEHAAVFSLDKDFSKAMNMLSQIDEIEKSLPGLDCGSCGAPSCRSFAEDIVRGYAETTDCIILLTEKLAKQGAIEAPLAFRNSDED